MRAAIAALALAGCVGDLGPIGPDAAPPPPLSLEDGLYALEWTCESGCVGLAPMTTYNRLERVGSELRWFTESTTNEVLDSATLRQACVGGSGLAVGSNNPTSAYEFCPASDGPQATLSWASKWGPRTEQVWTVTAVSME
jgi:hypothetical protein